MCAESVSYLCSVYGAHEVCVLRVRLETGSVNAGFLSPSSTALLCAWKDTGGGPHSPHARPVCTQLQGIPLRSNALLLRTHDNYHRLTVFRRVSIILCMRTHT